MISCLWKYNLWEREILSKELLANGLGSPWTLKAMFLLYLKTTTIPNTNCTNSNNKYKTVPNTKVKAWKWFGNDMDLKAIFLLYLKTIWSHKAFNLTFFKVCGFIFWDYLISWCYFGQWYKKMVSLLSKDMKRGESKSDWLLGGNWINPTNPDISITRPLPRPFF